MTKVVHLTSVHKPYDTRIFQKQCRSLASHGYDVVLVACHDKREIHEGVEIIAIKKHRNRFERFCVTNIRIVFAALRQKDVDLYHLHDPELLPFGILMRWLGKNVLYDMHENVPKAIYDKRWLPAPLRRLVSVAVHFFERVFLQKIPIVFAETSYQESYRFVRTHCTVRNMPFKVEEGEKSTIPTVGYIGGLSTDRGIDTTLNAIEILAQRNCPVNFECVGDLSDDLATELALCDRDFSPAQVTWHGYQPPLQGWPIIKRCHVGLAILKPRPNFVGSFPTKMFEYMSFGIPVVVSNFPLYQKVVLTHRCGLCVDPESSRELADAIHWLLMHPEEAAAMGRRGRKAVENEYNWGMEFETLQTFYAKLLSSNGKVNHKERAYQTREVA